jgi:pimeloyl-ACP methyl ester carboxylesterase
VKRLLVAAAVAATLALAATRLPAADAPKAKLQSLALGQGSNIVLIHGLGGGRLGWMPTARKLFGKHRVVMVDLPGHGETGLADPFSLDAAAEALTATLATMRGDSTIVVGQGVGGLLAIKALSARPELAKGLIVIDTGIRFESPVPDQQQRMFIDFMDENYDQFLKMMFGQQGRDSAQNVVLHAQASKVPPATIKAFVRQLLNSDATRELKALKRPLLFVGTEKRWPADKDWAALAKPLGYEGIPVQTRRIAGTGPLIATEQPDSLAATIEGFSAQALAKP